MRSEMEKDILKVLITEEELQERIGQLLRMVGLNNFRANAPCFWEF